MNKDTSKRLKHKASTDPLPTSKTPARERRAKAMKAENITEVETRSMFDLVKGKALPERINHKLVEVVMEVLDLAHPFDTWEVFRVAWPLGLQKLAEMAKEGGDE